MIEKSKAIKNGVKILDNSAKNEFFENLKSNFPQTIKDGKADLKAISLLLGIDKKADVSGYELTWTGKGLSNAMYSFPCNKELRLDEIYSNVDCHADKSARNDKYQESSLRGSDEVTTKQSKEIDCHASQRDASPKADSSLGDDGVKNIIIRGDNLDALKILKSAYTEKIKMIYIDPPYNTANDNFIYPDNFREDYKAILREVGLIEIDENGEETESENLRFFKNIQSSRTHSGWLSFMLPRLKLARDLLKEDGVIFISIDDNEQANLKILCDEIFGEDNFVCNFIWKCRTSKQYSSVTASIQTDYILCYGKNKDMLLFNKIWGEKDGLGYKNPDNDPNGAWITSGLIRDDGRKKYKIITPSGKEYYEAWLYTEENMKKFRENGELWFGIDGDAKPRKKSYLKDFEGNITSNLLIGSEIGTNEYGTNEVKSFFKNQPIFNNPKPTKLIKYLLEVVTSANKNSSKNNNNAASAHCVNNSKESAQGVETPCYQGSGDVKNGVIKEEFPKALKVAEPTVIANEVKQSKEIDCHADKSARNDNTEADIILDFFAGSGTTAQAVMELNEEDGGNRQFILVQIDEEIKEEKSKSAYDFCKNELKSDKPVISDITIERVKRAANKIMKNRHCEQSEAIHKEKDCHASIEARNDNNDNEANATTPSLRGSDEVTTKQSEKIDCHADTGFKIFTLSDKPEIITNEEKSLELISQRTLNNMDIIINMALTNGKTLDKKIETIFDGKLYKCEDTFYLIECDKEILKFLSETQNEYILIDAYGDMELEDFLNLGAGFKERLRVVY